jgi:CubicO group peptidase (beta-lactamase class C family)
MLQGYVHPDFARVARALESQLRRSGGGGAALCIYHRGEPVVDCWGGCRDEEGNPWEQDTLALSYSTSKGMASTLTHILVDQGLLDYDTPVAEYWPEFGRGGKQDITVRQVMCHEAGLFDIRGMVDDASRMLDWEYMIEALGDAVPAHPPGNAHGYHGLTYGHLVGELAQRVTGKAFSELLRSEIAERLDLDGLFIGLPRSEHSRAARLIPSPLLSQSGDGIEKLNGYVRSLNRALRVLRMPVDLERLAGALVPEGMERLDFNSADFLSASIPAANGMFTARSLAKVYATLANDGELDGVRLIERSTLWQATEVQNRGVGLVIPLPMHWRLGYHRVPTIGVSVRNGFGHFGFGGSGAWADPDRQLAVAMTLNSGVGTPFGDMRMVRIGTAAVRCSDRRD